MAKKRRLKKKVKKLMIRSFLIAMIGIGSFFSYQYLSPRIRLDKLGYQKEEIKAIMELEDKTIDDILEMEYVDKLLTWQSLSSHLERYHTYVDYNKIFMNLDEQEVVTTVNKVLDNPEIFIFSKTQDINDFFKQTTPTIIDEYLQSQPENLIKNIDDVSLLVNKKARFSMSYEPANLEECAIASTEGETWYLASKANQALKEMAEDAKKEGYELLNNSSYRSYFAQEEIYQYYLDLYDQAYCDDYVANPGESEHQSGLAIDLSSRSVMDDEYFVFGESQDYDWVVEHCHEYGFVLRFPEDKVDITEVANEPWHFRYVGKEVAKKMKENNWCLEEYHQYK